MSVNLRCVLKMKHFTSDNTSPNTNPKTNPTCTSLPGFRLQTRIVRRLRRQLGPSIYDVHTEGEGGQAQVDACGRGRGSSPRWTSTQKIKKKMASFLPEFRLWTE